MDLRLEVVTVTQWQQNCSILCPAEGGPAVLIDPGGETDRVLAKANEIGVDIQWQQNWSTLCDAVCGHSSLIDTCGRTHRFLMKANEIAADIQAILVTHEHIHFIGGLNQAIALTCAPVSHDHDVLWLFEQGM